jgi:hypothetical protein
MTPPTWPVNLLALVCQQHRVHTKEGQCCTAWLALPGKGHGRNHRGTCLCLPPRVDNGAPALTNYLRGTKSKHRYTDVAGVSRNVNPYQSMKYKVSSAVQIIHPPASSIVLPPCTASPGGTTPMRVGGCAALPPPPSSCPPRSPLTCLVLPSRALYCPPPHCTASPGGTTPRRVG